MLVDVVVFVGGRQHLRFVDVVDADRLQDLGLDEVADTRLRHHRDRDGVADLLDQRHVAHASDAAGGADIGRHALQRHHGAGARFFGDLGVLRGDDVHDHAALEHLRQPGPSPST